MPNPIFNVHKNTGKMPQTHEEEIEEQEIDPVTEEYAGDNIPYRGTQLHGVPWDDGLAEVLEPDTETDEVPEFAATPTYPEPVPVFIVQQGDSGTRQVVKFRTSNYPLAASDSPLMIASQDRARKRITITASTDDVVIAGSSDTCNSTFGFRPTSSGPFVLETTDAIYAANTSDSTDANVSVLIEYVVKA